MRSGTNNNKMERDKNVLIAIELNHRDMEEISYI